MADHSSVSARRSTKPRRPNIRLYGYMIDHANYVRCARQRPVYTEMRGHGDPHTQPPRGPWTDMIIYEAHMEAYQSCIRNLTRHLRRARHASVLDYQRYLGKRSSL
jgi:pullulanase/glycogen debranching enzyme